MVFTRSMITPLKKAKTASPPPLKKKVNPFKQVCVWPGTIVGAENVQDFEKFILDEFDVRVQYLEEVYTAPDLKDGYPVKGTGGRCDVFFAVHNEDVMKFAVPRLSIGIRWVEDVYGNDGGHLYPKRIAAYQSWATA